MDEADQGYAAEKPEQLISEYLYGEHIHWGDHAETLAKRGESPFDDAWFRMTFLEAVLPLAHLYIGFGVAVEAALATRGA